MSSNRNSSSGIGICGVLTIVFVVLKLVGVINWSWLWVLCCPLWIDILLTVIILVVLAVLGNKKIKKNEKSGRIKW